MILNKTTIICACAFIACIFSTATVVEGKDVSGTNHRLVTDSATASETRYYLRHVDATDAVLAKIETKPGCEPAKVDCLANAECREEAARVVEHAHSNDGLNAGSKWIKAYLPKHALFTKFKACEDAKRFQEGIVVSAGSTGATTPAEAIVNTFNATAMKSLPQNYERLFDRPIQEPQVWFEEFPARSKDLSIKPVVNALPKELKELNLEEKIKPLTLGSSGELLQRTFTLTAKIGTMYQLSVAAKKTDTGEIVFAFGAGKISASIAQLTEEVDECSCFIGNCHTFIRIDCDHTKVAVNRADTIAESNDIETALLIEISKGIIAIIGRDTKEAKPVTKNNAFLRAIKVKPLTINTVKSSTSSVKNVEELSVCERCAIAAGECTLICACTFPVCECCTACGSCLVEQGMTGGFDECCSCLGWCDDNKVAAAAKSVSEVKTTIADDAHYINTSTDVVNKSIAGNRFNRFHSKLLAVSKHGSVQSHHGCKKFVSNFVTIATDAIPLDLKAAGHFINDLNILCFSKNTANATRSNVNSTEGTYSLASYEPATDKISVCVLRSNYEKNKALASNATNTTELERWMRQECVKAIKTCKEEASHQDMPHLDDQAKSVPFAKILTIIKNRMYTIAKLLRKPASSRTVEEIQMGMKATSQDTNTVVLPAINEESIPEAVSGMLAEFSNVTQQELTKEIVDSQKQPGWNQASLIIMTKNKLQYYIAYFSYTKTRYDMVICTLSSKFKGEKLQVIKNVWYDKHDRRHENTTIKFSSFSKMETVRLEEQMQQNCDQQAYEQLKEQQSSNLKEALNQNNKIVIKTRKDLTKYIKRQNVDVIPVPESTTHDYVIYTRNGTPEDPMQIFTDALKNTTKTLIPKFVDAISEGISHKESSVKFIARDGEFSRFSDSADGMVVPGIKGEDNVKTAIKELVHSTVRKSDNPEKIVENLNVLLLSQKNTSGWTKHSLFFNSSIGGHARTLTFLHIMDQDGYVDLAYCYIDATFQTLGDIEEITTKKELFFGLFDGSTTVEEKVLPPHWSMKDTETVDNYFSLVCQKYFANILGLPPIHVPRIPIHH